MRTARLVGEGRHHVHVMSRIVQRQFLLKQAEKQHFLKLVRRYEKFCGVPVLCYAILDNHFHLILEQPDVDALPDLTVDLLFQRLPAICSESRVEELREQFEEAQKANNTDWIERQLAGYAKRMHSVSFFMKEVKQRFSQWYNLRNDRRGTLWEERYKSVLVENSRDALMTMAAYIDLNAVRAGIKNKPEDYRWCSYGAAVGGDKLARKGLGRILDETDPVSGNDFEADWEEASKLYRLWLYHEGQEVKPDLDKGERGRKGMSQEDLEVVERLDGKLPLAKVLRCRVRYFSDGAAIGSADFVEKVFNRNRKHFGQKRKTGARVGC